MVKVRQLILVGVTGAIVLAGMSVPAGASPASGNAAVTQPDQVTRLVQGGSATQFSLVLPRGAACAGDSAHDGYRLYSFLIPAGETPRAVDFESTVPSKWFGVYTEEEYYVGLLDPGTGQVVDIPPDFTWARLPASALIPPTETSAKWTAGLICVNGRYQDQNYWTAGFEFIRSATDSEHFTWRVTHPVGLPSGGSSLLLGLIPFVVALVLAIVAIAFHRADGGARLGRKPARTPTSQGAPRAC